MHRANPQAAMMVALHIVEAIVGFIGLDSYDAGRLLSVEVENAQTVFQSENQMLAVYDKKTADNNIHLYIYVFFCRRVESVNAAVVNVNPVEDLALIVPNRAFSQSSTDGQNVFGQRKSIHGFRLQIKQTRVHGNQRKGLSRRQCRGFAQ